MAVRIKSKGGIRTEFNENNLTKEQIYAIKIQKLQDTFLEEHSKVGDIINTIKKLEDKTKKSQLLYKKLQENNKEFRKEKVELTGNIGQLKQYHKKLIESNKKELEDINKVKNISKRVLNNTESLIKERQEELKVLDKILKDKNKYKNILIQENGELLKEGDKANNLLSVITKELKEAQQIIERKGEVEEELRLKLDVIVNREKRCGVRERSLIRKYKQLGINIIKT